MPRTVDRPVQREGTRELQPSTGRRASTARSPDPPGPPNEPRVLPTLYQRRICVGMTPASNQTSRPALGPDRSGRPPPTGPGLQLPIADAGATLVIHVETPERRYTYRVTDNRIVEGWAPRPSESAERPQGHGPA